MLRVFVSRYQVLQILQESKIHSQDYLDKAFQKRALFHYHIRKQPFSPVLFFLYIITLHIQLLIFILFSLYPHFLSTLLTIFFIFFENTDGVLFILFKFGRYKEFHHRRKICSGSCSRVQYPSLRRRRRGIKPSARIKSVRVFASS